jgi:hypothetical protein
MANSDVNLAQAAQLLTHLFSLQTKCKSIHRLIFAANNMFLITAVKAG